MRTKQIAKANSFAANLLLSFSLSTITVGLALLVMPAQGLPLQRRIVIEDLVIFSFFGSAVAIPWIVSAKNFESEVEDFKTNTPCKRCKFYSQELQAHYYLKHPCAVHPTGKPSVDCRDWENVKLSAKLKHEFRNF